MNKYTDINNYIDSSLRSKGMAIIQVTESILINRLDEIMNFTNGIIREHVDKYNWIEENKEYFLNPLVRKFDFSFLIEDINTHEICFLSFSSQYEKSLHLHFAYGDKKYRNLGLAKYNQLKTCNEAYNSNLLELEAYWPIHNNGSIALFLKMGWKITDIRKNRTQLFMKADTKLVISNILYLLNYNDK
jgi:hypothetical protein